MRMRVSACRSDVRFCGRLVGLMTLISMAACEAPAAPQRRTEIPLPKDTLAADWPIDRIPFGLSDRPVPDDNPLSNDRVRLGRLLFFSPELSANRTVSCASCHQPDHGFASGDRVAIGINNRRGTRNVPSLFNRAYGKNMFWDGRAASLEAQAVLPIVNQAELGNTYPEVLRRLRANTEVADLFRRAFADRSGSDDDPVTIDNLGRALASFQRTLLLGDSPVDRFQSGRHSALTAGERQGLWLFESRGGCWKCHSGSNFSDEQFHNTGIGFGRDDRDPGRFGITRKPADRFAFKTPTLRGVAKTAPYMHDGSLRSLKEVVEFYSRGGERDDPLLDRRMRPLGLSDEDIEHLVSFLKALSRPSAPESKKKPPSKVTARDE